MKRQKMIDDIENAPNDGIKKRLIEQLKEFERKVESKIKVEKDKQDLQLQERLAQRRKKKAEREAEVKHKYAEEKEKSAMEKIQEEKQLKETINDDRLERLIEEIRVKLSAAELPFALEKLIDNHQMSELSDLLYSQFQKKANKLRTSITNVTILLLFLYTLF